MQTRTCGTQNVYRSRKPKASPLWQCLSRNFDTFLRDYEASYQSRYGFLRPVIPEVVNKFLDCGDLERGFARVRCDHCKHEYLLAFSCKGRRNVWPSTSSATRSSSIRCRSHSPAARSSTVPACA